MVEQKGAIFIISYFGEGDKLRSIRKEKHEIQLDFWLKEKKYPIYIVAMDK